MACSVGAGSEPAPTLAAYHGKIYSKNYFDFDEHSFVYIKLGHIAYPVVFYLCCL